MASAKAYFFSLPPSFFSGAFASAAGAAVVNVTDGDAGIERGVLVVGDRVRTEVSPAALVAERREDLLALADRALFGAEAHAAQVERIYRTVVRRRCGRLR